jgi:hypothetical protein
MGDHEDTNLRMAEGVMKMGEGDEGRALPVYKMGENIGRYFSGEAGGSGRLTAGCGTSRAYTIAGAETGRVHKASEESSH